MKEANFYKKIKPNVVRCRVCNHFCKISDRKVGICGVRQNIKGKLFSLVYGLTTGLAIDPIEKKPLYHFLPGTNTLSFGTLGCNLRCANCQNYFYSQIFEKKGKVDEHCNFNWGEKIKPDEIVRSALEFNCQSIAYTYNEPSVFVEYALETMKLARKKGFKNVWVSNGFMSDEVLTAIIPYLDAINVDIKSFDDKFYQDNCGAKLDPVLENCQKLVKNKIWLEVTTLVIPTLSDDLKSLKNLALFIKNNLGENIPWHISAFSGEISWKLKNLPDTKASLIKKIWEIGKEIGLKYVYAGNVWDEEMNDTKCDKCGEIGIKRKSYNIENNLINGKCRNCGEKVYGVWS